jgi:cysteine desulfurase
MAKSIKNQKKIYLDYASSALVREANGGAIHELGVKEKNKLENTRAFIAKILAVNNNEIIFTSGATESNNLAILGLVQNFKKPHIVTTNIEHSSVLEVCRHLEKIKQAEVTYVEVEKNGIVDPKKIKKAIKSNTVLVSVMYANNEIGSIQPIQKIAKEIRHFKKVKFASFSNGLAGVGDPENRGPEKNLRTSLSLPFFQTDATQAINYLPIQIPKLGVDLLSFNSAKIYGPKGIGVLYIKKNTPIKKIMFGGEQEFGLRPGTENTALATGLAKAFQVVEKIKEKEVKRLTKLRDYFIKEISRVVLDTKLIINGDSKNRLPNNVNISFPKIPSDLLVIELSAKGIMASAKSACKSGESGGSYVIDAIRQTQGRASHNSHNEVGGVRFSLGRDTTKKDINYTVKALSHILQKLKKWYD